MPAGDTTAPARPALHPQARALMDRTRGGPKTERTVAESRRRLDALATAIGPGPDAGLVTDVAIAVPGGSVPARLYDPTPPGQQPDGVVVYFHGGGWVAGNIDQFDAFCRHFTRSAKCRVLSVGFRLAPESRFPTPVYDAFAACEWAAGNLTAGGPVVVMGDSAGGNLAAACALLARDRGQPAIALQILVYPILSRDFDTASYRAYGEGGMLGTADMRWYWQQYAADTDRDNPLACPMLADVEGVAPALIVVAEHDPLRDDGLGFGERLRSAGVAVQTHHYADMPHGFFTMVTLLDANAAAIARVGGVVKQLRHNWRT